MMSTYCQDKNTQSGQFSFGSFGNVQYITKTSGQVANERMRVKLENGLAQLSRGWNYSFGTTATYKFNGSIYIGTVNADSMKAGAPMDVYRFKVFEGSSLVHDFVPVMRTSDNVVGLYDTYGDLGFRPAANADYCTSGGALSSSDDEWIEIATNSGFEIIVR